VGLKVVLRGLGQARDQVVEIFHLDTGDTVTPWMRVADFVQGAWMVWRCPAGTGSLRVRTRFLRGGDAVISGIFFDAAPATDIV
jgi:hypothetical protein